VTSRHCIARRIIPVRSFWLTFALAGCLLGAVNSGSAREYRPTTADEITTMLHAARAGDVVTIEPGTYDLPRTLLDQSGSADRPIIVRAARPGSDWTFENLDIAGYCTTDSQCEHAFHIVSGADRTIIRHNRMRDFNAHIKGNGEDGRFPEDVVMEGNTLFLTRYRATDNPVALIDVVGGRRWVVRENLIADVGKTVGHAPRITDDFAYGLFLKGNSSGGLIERNVVACALALPPGPVTFGISLGGSSTGPGLCEGTCDTEHRHGLIRNNVVLNCPSEAGIYLYKAEDSRVFANTLYNTYGILARQSTTNATVVDNIISGGILASEGAQIDASHNLVVGGPLAPAVPEGLRALRTRLQGVDGENTWAPGTGPVHGYLSALEDMIGGSDFGRGTRRLDHLLRDPVKNDFELRPGAQLPVAADPLDAVPDDICGNARPIEPKSWTLGAIQDSGRACRFVATIIANYRTDLRRLKADRGP
jgi:hypothetical protein